MIPRYVNKANLQACTEAARGYCSICGKRAQLDAHHWWKGKGAGGGDYPWNLVAVCRECHNMAHGGIITKERIAVVVGAREGVPAVNVVEKLEELHAS